MAIPVPFMAIPVPFMAIPVCKCGDCGVSCGRVCAPAARCYSACGTVCGDFRAVYARAACGTMDGGRTDSYGGGQSQRSR
eukprot:1256305-Rhodomonas_salina.2